MDRDHPCQLGFHSGVLLEIVDVIRVIRRWALKWKIDNIPCGEQDCKVWVL